MNKAVILGEAIFDNTVETYGCECQVCGVIFTVVKRKPVSLNEDNYSMIGEGGCYDCLIHVTHSFPTEEYKARKYKEIDDFIKGNTK
ncbi:MAG: hypothetical protein NZ730_06570 [Porticoccaceae bacterium]|nr:hypothetical protein [Porticoccaceae bacterium]